MQVIPCVYTTITQSPSYGTYQHIATLYVSYATYIASVLISALPALGSGLDEDEEYSAGLFSKLLLLSDFPHYLLVER